MPGTSWNKKPEGESEAGRKNRKGKQEDPEKEQEDPEKKEGADSRAPPRSLREPQAGMDQPKPKSNEVLSRQAASFGKVQRAFCGSPESERTKARLP